MSAAVNFNEEDDEAWLYGANSNDDTENNEPKLTSETNMNEINNQKNVTILFIWQIRSLSL